MVYNIAVVCQNGASTSALVDKMRKAAQDKNLEIVINAYAESKLDSVIDDVDIVLLAPQIRHKRKGILKKYDSKEVQFMNIEPTDYGMLNGAKVLNQAIEKLD